MSKWKFFLNNKNTVFEEITAENSSEMKDTNPQLLKKQILIREAGKKGLHLDTSRVNHKAEVKGRRKKRRRLQSNDSSVLDFSSYKWRPDDREIVTSKCP